MNSLFSLENPLVDYTSPEETKLCEELECENTSKCVCSNCICCSVCSAKCGCPMAIQDPNQKIAEILGLGDWAYRLVTVLK